MPKKTSRTVVVLDVPLLFESGMQKLCDMTIVVKAPKSVQVKRAETELMITKDEAIRRIENQMPLTQKIRQADIIIDGNKKLYEVQKRVKIIWKNIQKN